MTYPLISPDPFLAPTHPMTLEEFNTSERESAKSFLHDLRVTSYVILLLDTRSAPNKSSGAFPDPSFF